MSDFKSQFKAAKAVRGSGSSAKLSKEQIRALKAQRAAAEAKAAEEAAKQKATQEAARQAAAAAPPMAAAAASTHPTSGGAPRAVPPPRFAPAAPPKFGLSPALTTDSQITQVHSGDSSVSPAALQSTASKELSPAEKPSPSAAQHSAPAELPGGFFEAPDEAASGAASALPQEFFEAPDAAAASEAGSAQPAAQGAVQTDESHASLPAGFFEASADPVEDSPAPPAAPLPPASSAAAQPKEQPGIIPKGFFADKEADAKARGEDKKKKSKEEEFSDFMTSIAVDVREAEERDQETAADAAAERAEREQFEQRMRLQRLEELKTGSSEAQKQAAAYTLSDAALDVDVILEEASQSRKRRKVDVKQFLEPAAEEGDDASSEEDLELDWRAKTV